MYPKWRLLPHGNLIQCQFCIIHVMWWRTALLLSILQLDQFSYSELISAAVSYNKLCKQKKEPLKAQHFSYSLLMTSWCAQQYQSPFPTTHFFLEFYSSSCCPHSQDSQEFFYCSLNMYSCCRPCQLRASWHHWMCIPPKVAQLCPQREGEAFALFHSQARTQTCKKGQLYK